MPLVPIEQVYTRLLAAYGPQEWWPADSRFEIMAGALVVQRTTWTNTRRALSELKSLGLLDPVRLAVAPIDVIERCIYGAGFYRTKAGRLRGLAQYVAESGGASVMAAWPTPLLRSRLLQLSGVGAETAAAILLYAFERPVVVIDAYLRRLLQRLAGSSRSADRDSLIDMTVRSRITDTSDLNEWHALVVEHGKRTCVAVPRCSQCCLRNHCSTGLAESEAELG